MSRNIELYFTTAVILNLYFLIWIVVFYHQRRDPIFVRRLPNVMWVTSFTSVILANYYLLNFDAADSIFHHLPCWLQLFLEFNMLSLWHLMYFFRITHVLICYKVNTMLLQEKRRGKKSDEGNLEMNESSECRSPGAQLRWGERLLFCVVGKVFLMGRREKVWHRNDTLLESLARTPIPGMTWPSGGCLGAGEGEGGGCGEWNSYEGEREKVKTMPSILEESGRTSSIYSRERTFTCESLPAILISRSEEPLSTFPEGPLRPRRHTGTSIRVNQLFQLDSSGNNSSGIMREEYFQSPRPRRHTNHSVGSMAALSRPRGNTNNTIKVDVSSLQHQLTLKSRQRKNTNQSIFQPKFTGTPRMKTKALFKACGVCVVLFTSVLFALTIPLSRDSSLPITFSSPTCRPFFSIPFFVFLLVGLCFMVYVLCGIQTKQPQMMEMVVFVGLSLLNLFIYFFFPYLFTEPSVLHMIQVIARLTLILVCFSWSVTYPAILIMRRSHKLASLHPTPCCFNQVLNDPKQYSQFKTVVADQFCYENVMFYETYVELRTELGFCREREALIARNALCRHLDYSAITATPFSPISSYATSSPQQFTTLISSPIIMNAAAPFQATQTTAVATAVTIPHPSQSHVNDYFANRIIEIYHEFIAPNSPQELNIAHSLRVSVAEEIDRGNIDIKILRPVFREVYDMLYHNSYPQYLMSKLAV